MKTTSPRLKNFGRYLEVVLSLAVCSVVIVYTLHEDDRAAGAAETVHQCGHV